MRSGLVIVDKPGGMTSHDVINRMRRIAGTRRVGHAGTLDPMATGVLVIGVERGTKLLGHLALTDKSYDATIRLGAATLTDDADGEVVSVASAALIGAKQILAGLSGLRGKVTQVPSAVSAIKVAGKRSYARVRAGEQVDLAAREVTVSRLDLVAVRRLGADLVDVDVTVDCSTGTYIRAIARDLGSALAVGGHLVALRRTRVGPFEIAGAMTLNVLAESAQPVPIDLDAAVSGCFPRRDLDAEQARYAGHGRVLPGIGIGTPYGVFGPDGHVIALLQETDGVARPLVVLNPG